MRPLLPLLPLLAACAGGTAKPADTATDSGTATDGCSAGPATLEGLAVSFARSETEIEIYRFADGTFTRDIMAGEASENTGTWTWAGTPDCTLALAHAAVPPDWPEAFASTYVIAWSSATAGTFTVTRTFPDGFVYEGSGTAAVVP